MPFQSAVEGWGRGSVVVLLPCMHEALGSIPGAKNAAECIDILLESKVLPCIPVITV